MRIGIVDDHPAGRVALREALSQQQGVVVQWDARSDEAHARVALEPVDVVLVDVLLTNLTDTAAGGRVLSSGTRRVPVVIISTDGKDPAALIDLVSLVRQRLEGKGRRASGAGSPLRRLSRREAQVLSEVRAGRTNREIATRLQISVATVNKHVHQVLTKLGARNRAQAASLAASATRKPTTK